MFRQILRRITSPATRRELAFKVVSARRPTARWRPLPSLLVIGGQRCGTSSLFKYLGAHPSCRPSIRKEIRFFTEFYEKGEEWYRAHFPLGGARGNGSEPVYFEATPDYLLDPRVPKRALELMPDVRILVLLRDPVKRAYSHEFLRYSYVERGRYGKHLERWLDRIGDPSRLLVLRSEDLFRDTDATFQEILQFLGLPEWRPERYRNFSYGDERPTYPPMVDECREWLVEQFAADRMRLGDILGPRAHLLEEWIGAGTR